MRKRSLVILGSAICGALVPSMVLADPITTAVVAAFGLSGAAGTVVSALLTAGLSIPTSRGLKLTIMEEIYDCD